MIVDVICFPARSCHIVEGPSFRQRTAGSFRSSILREAYLKIKKIIQLLFLGSESCQPLLYELHSSFLSGFFKNQLYILIFAHLIIILLLSDHITMQALS